MPKWQKDAKEFAVSVTYHETRGYQCYIPRPLMEHLGKPHAVKFIIKGSRIEIEAHKF
jgi:hypothetical protein